MFFVPIFPPISNRPDSFQSPSVTFLPCIYSIYFPIPTLTLRSLYTIYIITLSRKPMTTSQFSLLYLSIFRLHNNSICPRNVTNAIEKGILPLYFTIYPTSAHSIILALFVFSIFSLCSVAQPGSCSFDCARARLSILLFLAKFAGRLRC